LSTIQRLETRIAKLEADLHRRQTSVAAHPPEIWMVQAKARPGETWPTDSTTRFFDGFLVEPVYYPDEVTPTDVAHAHLADDEDPDKGCWIKFHSEVFVHEDTWLKVWRPQARGGQWFAFHGPSHNYRVFCCDFQPVTSYDGLNYSFDNPTVDPTTLMQQGGDADFEIDTSVSPHQVKCLTAGVYPVWMRVLVSIQGTGTVGNDSYLRFWAARLRGSAKTRLPTSTFYGQTERLHSGWSILPIDDLLGSMWAYVGLAVGDYIGIAYRAVGDSTITWDGSGSIMIGPRMG